MEEDVMLEVRVNACVGIELGLVGVSEYALGSMYTYMLLFYLYIDCSERLSV